MNNNNGYESESDNYAGDDIVPGILSTPILEWDLAFIREQILRKSGVYQEMTEEEIGLAISAGTYKGKTGLTFRTFRDYSYILRRFSLFSASSGLLPNDPEAMEKYANFRFQNQISFKTVRHEYDVLCKYAYDTETRPEWVGAGRRYILNRYDNEGLAESELKGILTELLHANKYDVFVICILCAGAGLRPHEILRLTKSSILTLLKGSTVALMSAKSNRIDHVFLMKRFRPVCGVYQPLNYIDDSYDAATDESVPASGVPSVWGNGPDISEAVSITIDNEERYVGNIVLNFLRKVSTADGDNGAQRSLNVLRDAEGIQDAAQPNHVFAHSYEAYRKVYNRIRKKYMTRLQYLGAGVRQGVADRHYGSGFRELRKTFAQILNNSKALQALSYEERQKVLQHSLRHRGGPGSARIYISYPTRSIQGYLQNL
jgi:hypothetical protein